MIKNNYKPGEYVDAIHLSADGNAPMIDHLEVTASNSYRLYTAPTKYRTVYMYKGICYPGKGVLKITNTAGTTLTAGLIYAIY